MATKYISVITSRESEVQAYLYDHTVINARQDADLDRTIMVLETTGVTEERASFLAENQAGRLSSGMHGAKVHDTRDKALAHLVSLTN